MNEQWLKKLRLTADLHGLIVNPPHASYAEQLGLPNMQIRHISHVEQVQLFAEQHTQQFILLFVSSLQELAAYGPAAIQAVEVDGLLWICYPKGSSKIKTDINRDTGWQLLKTMGQEGVALVSLDDTWSAMRYRPEGMSGSARRSSKSEGSAANKDQQSIETEMPQDLQAALDQSASAGSFFQTLTASMRRDYIGWIVEAKRAETREKRIQSAIDKLERGCKRPTDK